MSNPERMQQMMNNPLVQQLMSNPEVMRQLITANPQMRELMEVGGGSEASYCDGWEYWEQNGKCGF